MAFFFQYKDVSVTKKDNSTLELFARIIEVLTRKGNRPLKASLLLSASFIIPDQFNTANLSILLQLTCAYESIIEKDVQYIVYWGDNISPHRSFSGNLLEFVPTNELSQDCVDKLTKRGIRHVTWMGGGWAENSASNMETLRILAHEYGHAFITHRVLDHVFDKRKAAPILGGRGHWSEYLMNGGCLMGGNNWESIADHEFINTENRQNHFSNISLFLMGLTNLSNVHSLYILKNVRGSRSSKRKYFSSLHTIASQTTVYGQLEGINLKDILIRNYKDYLMPYTAASPVQKWIQLQKRNTDTNRDKEKLTMLANLWPSFMKSASNHLIDPKLKPLSVIVLAKSKKASLSSPTVP